MYFKTLCCCLFIALFPAVLLSQSNNLSGPHIITDLTATKTDIFYIGVDNSVQIGLANAGQSEIIVTLQGPGTITANPADRTFYKANVTEPGSCKVIVSTRVKGKLYMLGSRTFQIRRIPDPVPMTGGKLRGGNVQAATLVAQSGILALLENFDFDARFNIVSFKVIYSSKGVNSILEAQGPSFTVAMKTMLGSARPKDVVIFDDIKVMGPDNVVRTLGQIAFTVI